MKNRYINPWLSKPGQIVYTDHDLKPVFSVGGFTVFKISGRHYDIVKDGVCCTQRAGANKERLAEIITSEEVIKPHTRERLQMIGVEVSA